MPAVTPISMPSSAATLTAIDATVSEARAPCANREKTSRES